ncbi:MAG: hypothetical protein H8E89_04385 [Candidatus Nitrosopelagicus sp.]|nr:hypothetical protein [Candidatus Nitrosopelagicus sp.]
MQETRTTASKITFFITLIVVLLLISAIIFPGLYHYFFGIYPVQLETPFEFGHNAYLLIGSNAVLFGFGLIYYKNKFSLLNSKIDQIRKFEISKKVSIVILIIILSTYAGFSIPELFLDEREQWGDYFLLEDAIELWPYGQSDDPYLSEQLDRYVRMALLDASVEIFQNIKVLPFFASILVIFFTYLLTVQFTGKRFAGIIAMLVLLQSYLFTTFDTIAVYENFWVLFFMISLYAIRRKWIFSPIFYILSVFTKAYVAPFFLMTLYSTYRSDIEKRKKYLIFGSYTAIIIISIALIFFGKSIYTDVVEIESSKFFLGFADTAMQFRYDIFFMIMLLPVTVGLYVLSKNNPDTDIIHSLIAGTIIFSPILITFTYFYEILPYRFVPTIVFFAIAIAFFFSKKSK